MIYQCELGYGLNEEEKGEIKGFLDLNKPFSVGFIYGGGKTREGTQYSFERCGIESSI